MSKWSEWKTRKNSAKKGQSEGDVLASISADPSSQTEDTLTCDISDGADNVVVAGAGVDRGRVDVLMPGDSLDEPEISGLPVDVGEAGVSEVVEGEPPIEPGALLPGGEHPSELPSAEGSSFSGDEDGLVSGDGLATLELPVPELPELVDEGVWEEDLLRDGLGSRPLEDAEEDSSTGDDFAVVVPTEDVVHNEPDDLELTETGPKGDGDDAVVSEPIFVIPSDPEYEGLLARCEGGGGLSDSGISHVPIVDVSDDESQRKKTKPEKKPRKKRGPLGIIKRTEEDFHTWLASEPGFLSGIARFDDSQVKLEPYQYQFLATKAHYRCVEKSRQVGYSWLFAAEAIARAHLRNSHNSIFVSYNLSDSKEKISYAKQFHEELPLEFQKKLGDNSKLQISFISNGANKRISTIYSHPSRAPRGKKGDIYLDELAHYANDREVYKGSTALILRSKGQMTVCSSPLGRRGQFWEISKEEIRPYPVYWRQRVPWWLCSFFRKDASNKGLVEAATKAPDMPTKERVYRFGSQGIIEQFESMPLEDFQQEFEVLYVDESTAFFPYSLILPCTNEDLELAEDFTQIKPRKDSRLVCGFDVGRKKDLSELSIFEETAGGKRICVGLFRYPKTKFRVQEDALRQMLDLLPIARLYIDQNGIGMNLAENLADDYPQVEPFTFSGPSKEILANDFKIALQNQTVVLPRDRELVSQIHSVRKKTTEAGRVVFTSNDTGEGHADRFWSVAMACQKERVPDYQPSSVCVTVIN